jgi:gephyrin
MIPFHAALNICLASTPHARHRESVPLDAALGRVLVSDAVSHANLPAHATSIKDGYAFRASAAAARDMKAFSVACSVRAGDTTEYELTSEDQCAYVTTGAPLPRNADTVVEYEAVLVGASSITLKHPVPAGSDVRQVGSDLGAGQVVVERGVALTPADIGLLATVGMDSALVWAKPVVGVLSTGDELVPPAMAAALGRGQVRDANRPMLLASARELGCVAHDLGLVRDDEGAIWARMRRAAALGCDVLVVSGGVSEGDRDFVRPLLERHGQVHFSKVSTKPGKVRWRRAGRGGAKLTAASQPVTFASLPFPDAPALQVFALPGNPASALVMFATLVAPALRQLAGHAVPRSREIPVRLAHAVQLDPVRPEFQRASLFVDAAQQLHLAVSTTGLQRSSRLLSAARADVLLDLPAGAAALPPGRVVSALVFRDLRLSARLAVAALRQALCVAVRPLPAPALPDPLPGWAVSLHPVNDLGEVDVARLELQHASASLILLCVPQSLHAAALHTLQAARLRLVPGVGERMRVQDPLCEDECFAARAALVHVAAVEEDGGAHFAPKVVALLRLFETLL